MITSKPVTEPAQTFDALGTSLSLNVGDGNGAPISVSGRFRRYRMDDDGNVTVSHGPPAFSMSSADARSGNFAITGDSKLPKNEQIVAIGKAFAAIDAALQQLATDLGL